MPQSKSNAWLAACLLSAVASAQSQAPSERRPVAQRPSAPAEAAKPVEGTPAPAAAVNAPSAARDARWVLRLADGRRLRVRARRLDPSGPWELRQTDAWVALPAQQVHGARMEAELLAELRAREQELRASPPGTDAAARAQLELVEFALEQGLQSEGLARLDGMLAAASAREDRALQTLIERHAPRVRVLTGPAQPASWAQAAKLPPSAREFALRQLGRELRAEDVSAQLQHELAAVDPARRAFAALALRRLQPGKATAGLLERALYDGAEPVRIEAARALRDGEAHSALKPLLGGLGASSSAVRANAAQALGVLSLPAAVPALIAHAAAAPAGSGSSPRAHVFTGKQQAYVNDYDVEVATGETIADPQIGVLSEGSVLDVRVLGVSTQARAREQRAVETALVRLTGARVGAGSKAWARWWEREGQAWYAQHAPQTGPNAPR
jgi:hypothetical protein